MNQQDRDAIEGVFTRLQSLESQGAPRDGEAESYIRERMQAQPGAAYYLAQTVVVQEQALQAAQRRIAELESRAGAAPGGQPAQAGKPGTLAEGFGRPAGLGGSGGRQGAPAAASSLSADAGFGRSARGGAGGFLAGAMQTAMGVAGGLMLGNLLGGLFASDAQAAEPAQPEAQPEPTPEDPGATDAGAADSGFEDLGGFDEI
ncbi:DUF2076 domain-containing protein [Bordetella sp. 2513F-2]